MNNEGTDDESVLGTCYCVASGDRVEADTPVDATAMQMVKIEEQAELIKVCANIVRESDADLNPTLADMLKEIADQSNAIQNSARDIMVTYDD